MVDCYIYKANIPCIVICHKSTMHLPYSHLIAILDEARSNHVKELSFVGIIDSLHSGDLVIQVFVIL